MRYRQRPPRLSQSCVGTHWRSSTLTSSAELDGRGPLANFRNLLLADKAIENIRSQQSHEDSHDCNDFSGWLCPADRRRESEDIWVIHELQINLLLSNWAGDSLIVSARTGSSRFRTGCIVRCGGVAWAQCACSKTKKAVRYLWSGECIHPKNSKTIRLVRNFLGICFFVSVRECEKPRGSVHHKTGTHRNRSNYTTRCGCTVHALRLYIPSAIFQTDPFTRFIHIRLSPHDFHDPQAWPNPCTTNILFKPTSPVRVQFNWPFQTPSSNQSFTFTESERDIEVMPGGDYDDVDRLHSRELPFSSAMSWVLNVRWI